MEKLVHPKFLCSMKRVAYLLLLLLLIPHRVLQNFILQGQLYEAEPKIEAI